MANNIFVAGGLCLLVMIKVPKISHTEVENFRNIFLYYQKTRRSKFVSFTLSLLFDFSLTLESLIFTLSLLFYFTLFYFKLSDY